MCSVHGRRSGSTVRAKYRNKCLRLQFPLCTRWIRHPPDGSSDGFRNRAPEHCGTESHNHHSCVRQDASHPPQHQTNRQTALLARCPGFRSRATLHPEATATGETKINIYLSPRGFGQSFTKLTCQAPQYLLSESTGAIVTTITTASSHHLGTRCSLVEYESTSALKFE